MNGCSRLVNSLHGFRVGHFRIMIRLPTAAMAILDLGVSFAKASQDPCAALSSVEGSQGQTW